MSRIVADIDRLEALARALDQTKHELERLGIRMRGYEAALGTDRVRRGVDRLVSNWSDVRERTTAELETIFELVRDAAAEYRALEREIAAAAGEGTLPASDPGGG
jgi:hypothetical protein